MTRYNPKEIEPKWQAAWEQSGIYKAEDQGEKPKWYSLIEFPYPSGAGLHTGHIRSNTALDIVSRKRRMQGFNVLYPIGWDAFGLPTENFAIKTGRPPQEVTKENTDTFRRQLKSLGYSFDWSREVDTTDPNYYKWTQWLFLQFFKEGLAYKDKININWCPKCKIGLANEEVEQGSCERCGGPVEAREKEQWILKMTEYADKLLDGLDGVDFLPEIKTQQRNWIGRSEGAEINFPLSPFSKGSTPQAGGISSIKVFTTRPDTIYGATFIALAPNHSAIGNWKLEIGNYPEVKVFIEKAKEEAEGQRNADKAGICLQGITALNPATGEEIPVWVVNYVLGDVGTGAIMAVPQHDERDREFAEKYNLPILDKPLASWEEVLEKTGGKKVVRYKLRDWVFSRQRYWGEPIPLVFCANCAKEPGENSKHEARNSKQIQNSKVQTENKYSDLNYGWVAVPDEQLPVELPRVEKYQPTDTGESPLAGITEWVNTACPSCGGPATRETDVMPNWAGSSWYFISYCIAENLKSQAPSIKQFTSPEFQNKLKYWLPIDWYNGGMEHSTRHLLYARFWMQFLHDQGLVPVAEPFAKRTAQGMVLAADGKKMSKSLGNVVNPDELVNEFGADAVRLYEMFMGPFDQAIAWAERGILGPWRFLEKVWNIGSRVHFLEERVETLPEVKRKLHQTIKKVSEDIEGLSMNTAVSTMMEFVNMAPGKISKADWQLLLRILAPFAPHITEELYQLLGNSKHEVLNSKGQSIHSQPWPEYDEALLVEEKFELVIQVNGKVRATVSAQKGISQAQAEEMAKPAVSKWLEEGEVKKIVFVADRLINFIVS
ncbi:MAG: leucine--tRNA ligase [Candidatus Harrisonbacteria bacterium CG10_big_fil_rev_8_21_14_0_10_49_15]|uniref:Leucine--tRNA ligase n=1 Tax=Candidatus Harrisonbacteria bacterium CG10_big_fil_rev_8_21_14_0_10_49_15 TaxID=1974587 RepID=A0A2H0UL36_9BACT|nr:MAG: leucine--tRNA ligase [Candidatus Harrisonbacteria bacterium CG10_big_fil_rev_8_21_14_0_10_49_15]